MPAGPPSPAPPAPCARGTSPPERLLPTSERWDTERELKSRAPQPQPFQSLPSPLWVRIWEQLSLIPSSQVGLGTKGPVSRQPPHPPLPHHQAEHAAHGQAVRGRGCPTPPLAEGAFLGAQDGQGCEVGDGGATELGQTWGGCSGTQDGGPRGAIYIAQSWGRGPAEADLGWVVLAMSWGRRPELWAPGQTWRTDSARGNRGRDSGKRSLS